VTQATENRFLTYYHREISYLRNAGKRFATKHPKIARRLELSENESPDPHTERLLESFAFLTARLSQEIDDRLPQISAALLNVLYPQLTNPIPAMSIAQFEVDPSKGKLTTGFDIPRHTPLFINAEEGVACRFQTAYPVTLWPIKVIHVDLIHGDQYSVVNGVKQSRWYLRLRLNCQGLNFSDLNLKRLVFHICSDTVQSFVVYEAIFAQTNPQILCSVDGQKAKILPKDSLKNIGFEPGHLLLPTPEHAHPAYQLLLEYFHFPEKFLFMELDHLDFKEGQETAEILISIQDVQQLEKMSLQPSLFRLGCTPIVNLFKKITDPLRLDHHKFEYLLSPDQRRERTTEIYSILKVTSALDDTPNTETFFPYFSFDHDTQRNKSNVYWLSRRVSTEKRDIPGTDILLSFVDLKFDPRVPPYQTVFAYTLCTNRFLADQVPAGGLLQLEDRAPISQVTCLNKPVSQIYSPQDGETLWRLISKLSVSQLSLTQQDTSLLALKETLRLYAGLSNRFNHPEIEALISLTCKPTTRRIGDQAWRGFVPGLKVELSVNEHSLTGSSVFLLTSVLRHFFALQVSMNSFVQLQLNSMQRHGEWMQWQPLSGDQITL
jgi:type VI secretion system protein ImpG